MTEPLAIVPAKSDVEIAKEFRQRMTAALNGVCEIMREADHAGLQIDFALGRDQYARRVIAGLTIVRPL